MPYRWTENPADPTASLQLWPHRSLTARGFVWFIGATAFLLCLPLLTQLGSAGLWVLLPFLLAALGGIWLAIRRSNRTESEELTLGPEAMTLIRHRPGRPDLTWAANPHWVRLALHARGGPVPDYLVLTGNGRSVELGAFLTREERRALHARLQSELAALKAAPLA